MNNYRTLIILLFVGFLFSCNEDENKISYQNDGFLIEVISEIDGVQARSHVGGTTFGAGLYAGGEKCTVRALPNDGYTLESFIDEEGKKIDGGGYTFDVWNNKKFTAKFKKSEPQRSLCVLWVDNIEAFGPILYFDLISYYPPTSDIDLLFNVSGDYLYHDYIQEAWGGTALWERRYDKRLSGTFIKGRTSCRIALDTGLGERFGSTEFKRLLDLKWELSITSPLEDSTYIYSLYADRGEVEYGIFKD